MAYREWGLWPPARPKISEKLDGYGDREAMQRAEYNAEGAAICQQLVVVAAERPVRDLRVVVEWGPDMPAPVCPSPNASSPRASATPAVSNGSSSTSTGVGALLKGHQRLWKRKTNVLGYQKTRRLDIVLAQGGEPTGDEVVKDLHVGGDETEQKK